MVRLCLPPYQCDQKKIAKSLKKLPKYDFTRKMIDLTPLQKLPKNVGDVGKLIAAEGFKKLPKVQKIAQSGRTAPYPTPPLCY